MPDSLGENEERKTFDQHLKELDESFWSALARSKMDVNERFRPLFRYSPESLRTVVLVGEKGTVLTAHVKSTSPKEDWKVKSRSTRNDIIQYVDSNGEKGRVSLAQAVAEAWDGDPPEEGMEVHVDGDTPTKETVSWRFAVTQGRVISRGFEVIRPDEGPLYLKVYRYLQAAFVQIKHRENLSTAEFERRVGEYKWSVHHLLDVDDTDDISLERAFRVFRGNIEPMRLNLSVDLLGHTIETSIHSSQIKGEVKSGNPPAEKPAPGEDAPTETAEEVSTARQEVAREWREHVRGVVLEVVEVLKEEKGWSLYEVAAFLGTAQSVVHRLLDAPVLRSQRMLTMLEHLDTRITVEVEGFEPAQFQSPVRSGEEDFRGAEEEAEREREKLRRQQQS